MSRWRLLARLLRGRLRQALPVALTSAMLAIGFTAVVCVRASAATAVADGVRFSYADHAFTVQAIDASAAAVLARRTDLQPVWDSHGTAATGSREVPVAVRAVANVEAASGVPVRGHQPKRSGEAALSRAAAQALGVRLGDTVEIGDRRTSQAARFQVVGVTVNPADRDELTASTFAPGDRSEASLWLTNADPFVDRGLKPLLDRREAKGRTVQLLASDDKATAVRTLLFALRYAGPALALLAICLGGVLIAALRRERRRDVEALAAAGMPLRAGWRLLATGALSCLAAGAAIGTVGAAACMHLLRSQVSAPIGQDWQSISIPWGAVLLYLAAVPIATLLAAWAVTRGAALAGALGSLRFGVWTRTAVALIGAAAWVTLAIRPLGLSNAALLALALTGGLCTAVSAPLLLATVTAGRAGPALRRLIAVSLQPLIGLAVAVGVLVFFVSYYAASQTHSSYRAQAEAIPIQPPGSMLINGVNEATRLNLEERYRSLGGNQTAHYLLPVETGHTVRATNPRMIECFRDKHPNGEGNVRDTGELLARCGPAQTMSPLNIVALTADPQIGDRIRTDPALVENGKVGIFDFTADSGNLLDATVTDADATPSLGGNMPAALVGVNSVTARRLNLTPSGGQLLALMDFATLAEPTKATVRRAISRLAGTAQISEDRGFDDGDRQAVATGVAISGAGMVILMLAAAGGAFLSSQQDLRQVLGQIGVDRRRRRVLGSRMLVVPLLANGTAAGAALLSVWLARARDGHGFGWAWSVPALAGILACGLLISRYGRLAKDRAA